MFLVQGLCCVQRGTVIGVLELCDLVSQPCDLLVCFSQPLIVPQRVLKVLPSNLTRLREVFVSFSETFCFLRLGSEALTVLLNHLVGSQLVQVLLTFSLN